MSELVIKSTRLEVSSSVPGFHCWPSAPDVVSFLREKHRHLFVFRAAVYVSRNDREVEFFLLQSDLINAVFLTGVPDDRGLGIDFGSRSCEEIATAVAIRLMDGTVPCRNCGAVFEEIEVSVHEDGENGAVVSMSRA